MIIKMNILYQTIIIIIVNINIILIIYKCISIVLLINSVMNYILKMIFEILKQIQEKQLN